jgi:hypothetical protein
MFLPPSAKCGALLGTLHVVVVIAAHGDQKQRDQGLPLSCRCEARSRDGRGGSARPSGALYLLQRGNGTTPCDSGSHGARRRKWRCVMGWATRRRRQHNHLVYRGSHLGGAQPGRYRGRAGHGPRGLEVVHDHECKRSQR